MLELIVKPEGTPLCVQPEIVALAGFSGRDQHAVSEHIEELQRIGVRTPETWPTVYAVTSDRVTTAPRLEVLHGETSGELEFAIVLAGNERFVAIASDHTDRRAEAVDIPLSKQAVARVISAEVWRVASVAEHWDEIRLESWVHDNGSRRLYQKGTMAALLPVDDLVALVQARSCRPLGDAIIFSGTFPLIGGATVFSPRFEMEMTYPPTGWKIRTGYDVVVNQWLREPRA
jgi:Protein of unknown function (DUF2848)